MELSHSETRRFLEFARKLSKAPSGAAVASLLLETLNAVSPVEELRLVHWDETKTWKEWIALSKGVEARTHEACPRPRRRGTPVFFDPRNAASGFIWISSRDPKAVQMLELMTPQAGHALLLHAALKRAERAAISENDMARHALRARDEERRRIAQELHDDLGQTLASLKLNLKWAENMIGGAPDLAEAAAELSGARATVGAMLRKIRNISHSLYPRVLDTAGLGTALEELLREATRRSGIQASYSTRGAETRLPQEVAGALYRCCQEAVSNAVRHSGASKINVQTSFRNHEVQIIVEDNGKGFDPARLYGADNRIMSSGFWTIRQRVADLGGAFRVSTARGRGVVVEIIVPIGSRNGKWKPSKQE